MMFRALGWLFALLGGFCLLVFGLAWGLAGMMNLTEVWLWAKIVGGVGAALIALWLFLDWGSLQDVGKDQTVVRSTVASVATLLSLAIVVALNVLGVKFDERWDLTESKRYTLSQQSIDIVKGLDREVAVTAFFMTGSPESGNFRELMQSYADHSSLLKVEYKDPYSDPLAAEQAKITSPSGTAIFEVGEGEQRVESGFDEEAVTNAIVKVTSDKQHVICSVIGHGERESDDESTMGGLGAAASKLQGQNYKVEPLTLATTQPAPANCEVVVLASPQGDLLPGELDKLAQYVAAGGHLIVMLDPLQVPNTAADMARYGVLVGNDVVIEGDPNRQVMASDPSFVMLDESSWVSHPITEKLEGAAVMRLVRSVAKGPEVAGVTVTELAHTTAMGWAETTLGDTAVFQPDAGVDRVGEVPVAVVAEVTAPEGLRTKTEIAPDPASPVPAAPPVEAASLPAKAGGKVAIFGDGDFAGNALVLQGINQDFFLNTIAWMVGESEQLSIRSNEAGKGKITVTVVTGFLAGMTSLIVVPGLTIIGAVGTWLARRRM